MKNIFLTTVLSFLGTFLFAQSSETFTSGSGSWTVPCGVTSVQVECWGAGGGGSGDASADFSSTGHGGGGGGYVINTLSVTPGNSISYSVGAGGTGGFGNSGTSGSNTTFGAVTASGGDGASTSSPGNGGGGSGGTLTWGTDGSLASGTTGGSGGSGGNGGSGGSGGPTGIDGSDGSSPGGGGGGAGDRSGGTQVGGNGGNGQIVITYTIVDNPPTGTAPANLTVECSGDVPAADPLIITDEADDCDPAPTVSWVGDVSDGNSCPEIITRTYRITDNSSNTTDVTQTITISDMTVPTGTAPADLTVETIGDVPAADPFEIHDEADNCSPTPTVSFVSDVSDGQTCPETITRTYSITDDCGNVTNLQQTITINDITDPTGTAPADITVDCNANIPAPDVLSITDEADNVSASPVVAHVSDVSDNNTSPEVITRTYSITDDCGNTIFVQQVITVSDPSCNPLSGNLDAYVDATCYGNCDGEAYVSVTGGAAPYTYDIGSGPQGTGNFTGLCAGTYTVTVTDDNSDQITVNVTISEPSEIIFSVVTVNDESSIGQCDGSIDVTVSGGNSPYNYYLDGNSAASGSFPNLCSNSYVVLVEDISGCTNDTTVSVGSPIISSCLIARYDFTGGANDASGNGNHGTVSGATLTADRFGNANSAYSFDGIDDLITSTIDFVGDEARSFSFWSKSDNAGIQVAMGSGDAASAGGVFEAIFNSPCEGLGVEVSSGVVTSSATTTDDQWHHYVIAYDPIEGGTVTDIRIYQDGVLLPNSSCSALNTAQGVNTIATVPFLIGTNTDQSTRWFDGEIDDIRVFGCALTNSEVDSIFQAEAPSITCGFGLNQSITQPTCSNSTNGAIDLMVAGGQAPISYEWSNGETTQDISSLQPGTYSVIVTDANGCDTTRTFAVPPANIVEINVVVNDASCGNDDGSAFVSVTQGTSPYEYAITSGDTSNIAQDLAAGYYSATVTDANGCSTSQVFVISDSDGPTINGVEIEPTCPDDTDGGVNVTITGGTSPFDYQWSDGTTTEDISAVGAGTYDLEVTDANGCVGMASFELTGGSAISLGSFTLTNPTCGNQDGEIAVSASGGNGNLSFLWSPNTGGQTTATATGLGAGAYNLMVTDDNGCTQSQNYMLANSTAPTAVIQAIQPVPCNGNGGGVNLAVTGGVPPFTYQWSNGATTQDISNVAIGDYDVQITDGNGCSDMISVTVPGKVPQTQDICVITVDSLTQTNLVVWEKPATPEGIEYYKIYREGNAAGVYNLADTVHYSSLSQWTDPIADPSVRGWRYKIGAVDSCGNEAQLSTYHKSIHLTVNQGVGNVFNLIWDDYVGQNIPSWIIERYHPSTGWIIIDTIPSNLGSYTDNNPPTQGNIIDYSVYGEPAGGCTATRAQDHNSTRSNQTTIAAPDASAIVEVGTSNFEIFPNPTEGVVNISTDYQEQYDLIIYDLQGKLISRKVYSGNVMLDVEELTAGVYIMKINGGEDELKVIKFVKK